MKFMYQSIKNDTKLGNLELRKMSLERNCYVCNHADNRNRFTLTHTSNDIYKCCRCHKKFSLSSNIIDERLIKERVHVLNLLLDFIIINFKVKNEADKKIFMYTKETKETINELIPHIISSLIEISKKLNDNKE